MKCAECQEHLVAYLEGALDSTTTGRVEEHLSDCSGCREECDSLRRLIGRLEAASRRYPATSSEKSISLDSRVMDHIVRRQALEIRRLKMRRRMRRIGLGGATAAAIALFFVFGWLFSRPASELRAAEVLAKAAEATPEISSIHIRGMVRTLPHDNFDLVWADGDLVPIEIWKSHGKPTKWRIDKPGRMIVMDGKSTVMFVKPDHAVKTVACERGFDTCFWHDLADVQANLTKELRAGLAKVTDMRESREKGDDGRTRRVVTVEVKSELAEDDALRDKFFSTASTRRTYWFDPDSGQLERMEAHLHTDKGDLLVFRLTHIEYNVPIDPAVYKLDLPKGVRVAPVGNQIENLPDNAKYEAMSPREAAEAFFNACAAEDWDEVEKFAPGMATPRIKDYLGGLKVISLGEAVKASKVYPGWHVPYEIELRSRQVHRHKLALRKDNPAKRFIIDGGL